MEKKKINKFGLFLMIIGIIVAVMSVWLNLDLEFVAGIMFGIGLVNLGGSE